MLYYRTCLAGTDGITITGKPGSNDSNIVEDDTQFDPCHNTSGNITVICISGRIIPRPS